MAIVTGSFRYEALIAGMDLISKYKVPVRGAVSMSPGTEGMIKRESDKCLLAFGEFDVHLLAQLHM